MNVIGSFHKLTLIMHITKKHHDWESSFLIKTLTSSHGSFYPSSGL